MFDVAPLYAPTLRHPDPPAEDFGGTAPTGSGVDGGPFLDDPTPTGEILITGAGDARANGNYKLQEAGVFAGPGGFTISQPDGPGTPFKILQGATVYYSSVGQVPTKWSTVSGTDPAPIGNFI